MSLAYTCCLLFKNLVISRRRFAALQDGLKEAVGVPLSLAEKVNTLWKPLLELSKHGNTACISDLQVNDLFKENLWSHTPSFWNISNVMVIQTINGYSTIQCKPCLKNLLFMLRVLLALLSTTFWIPFFCGFTLQSVIFVLTLSPGNSSSQQLCTGWLLETMRPYTDNLIRPPYSQRFCYESTVSDRYDHSLCSF